MKLLSVIAIAAATIAAVPASAVTYDLSSSFNGSNPAGAFTFGYIDPGLTTFTPFTNSGSFEAGQLSALIGPEAALGAYKNVSGSAFTAFSTVDVPLGALFLHPGPTLLSAVVFTAPSTGSYDFSFFAKLLSNSVITGTRLFSGSIVGGNIIVSGPGPALTALNPTFSIAGPLGTIAAGDSVFVALGPDGDYSYDSTQFNFTVSSVPEPASWALLIAGFGLTGAALRRRRAAIAA